MLDIAFIRAVHELTQENPTKLGTWELRYKGHLVEGECAFDGVGQYELRTVPGNPNHPIVITQDLPHGN
jgi:hypothetical protein